MARIELHGVCADNPRGASLENLHITFLNGQMSAIHGPRGAGKLLLLRVLAGLHAPRAGQVVFDGHDMSRIMPRDRRMGLMLANAAVFHPHLNVYRNLRAGLSLRGMDPLELDRRGRRVAQFLAMENLLDRLPHDILPLERFRLSLGRLLMRDLDALLLDDPLWPFDAASRLELQTLIGQIPGRFGLTTILATREETEARALGGALIELHEGRLVHSR